MRIHLLLSHKDRNAGFIPNGCNTTTTKGPRTQNSLKLWFQTQTRTSTLTDLKLEQSNLSVTLNQTPHKKN
eukprot:m.114811 g.114811  ORF g.114811 m.114811 type:complete len:71 (-) comp28373_c0_seq1:39-251(-)